VVMSTKEARRFISLQIPRYARNDSKGLIYLIYGE
jgi:hypothetical protein